MLKAKQPQGATRLKHENKPKGPPKKFMVHKNQRKKFVAGGCWTKETSLAEDRKKKLHKCLTP